MKPELLTTPLYTQTRQAWLPRLNADLTKLLFLTAFDKTSMDPSADSRRLVDSGLISLTEFKPFSLNDQGRLRLQLFHELEDDLLPVVHKWKLFNV